MVYGGSASRRDYFLLKMTGNADFIWAKQITVTDLATVSDIQTLSNGDILLSGVYWNSITLNPWNNPQVFSNSKGGAGFIARFSNQGDLIWLDQISGNQVNSEVAILAITSDGNSNIYSTGSFKETVDFDHSSAVHQLTANGTMNQPDIFVQSWGPKIAFGYKRINMTDISLYPNPSNGGFMLNLGNAIPEEIVIRDSRGVELHELKNVGLQQVEVNLDPGLYFVCGATDIGVFVKKLIIR